MIEELMRRLVKLEQDVAGLLKPEVGRWVDISASVSLYQNAAVAATVNYAKVFVGKNRATVIARLTATAAGSAGSNIYIILPDYLTPASGIASGQPLGAGQYLDGSVHYNGNVFYVADIGGLPALALRVATVTDGNVIGTNPNIAIASSDVFSVDATFEIS